MSTARDAAGGRPHVRASVESDSETWITDMLFVALALDVVTVSACTL